jgi:hypothetical protein
MSEMSVWGRARGLALCRDTNINLEKYSSNFYPNLDQALYFVQFISGYLTRFNSGILQIFLKFPLDRPEASPDFFQNFLGMGIRHVT